MFNTLTYCLSYFYHVDKASACIHTANVKFSPITFELAEIVSRMSDERGDHVTNVYALEVLSHKGLYDLDKGR